MHLKKSRRADGRIYLSAVHGYWDSKAKQSRTKTVKSFGYVDQLRQDFPDPIAHFEAVVTTMEQEREKQESSLEVRINKKAILKKGLHRKNFGFGALSVLYHELGLRFFFDNRREHLSGTYNLSSIVKLLVYGRILYPASKQKTHNEREKYFEKFDFSLDSIYRGLSDLALLSKDLQLFLHKRITKLYRRSSEVVYYDVTNYYFESDTTSELRQKGFSKEHRPDPIVAMGLLIDSAGIPITFDLFKGSTVDCQTLLPVLARVKRDFGFKRIIVVADKGLNTSDNVAYNLVKGDGYLFSKSIRQADASLRAWVLDRSGYSKTSDGTYTKSRLAQRSVYVLTPEGKKVSVPIEEKQVAVFSEKYAQRSAKKRSADIEKAQELIGDVSRYSKATHSGAVRFIKGLTIDAKTGELLEGKKVRVLDSERIEKEAELDGFYILTTSEKEKSSAEIRTIYSGLWKIEDSFKVTKSELRSRPVYLSRDDHIHAHFLICYLALVLVRILEMKTGHLYSTQALLEAMREASASHLEGNLWVFNYRSEVLDSIGRACHIDFSRKYMQLQAIRKIIGDTKK